jgi:hypothetical protein
METILPKIKNNLVLTLGGALAAYISFVITENFGSYVQVILGVSVVYLIYRFYFSPIQIKKSYDEADGFQNKINIRKTLETFFLGIEFCIAIQVVIDMIVKLLRML